MRYLGIRCAEKGLSYTLAIAVCVADYPLDDPDLQHFSQSGQRETLRKVRKVILALFGAPQTQVPARDMPQIGEEHCDSCVPLGVSTHLP